MAALVGAVLAAQWADAVEGTPSWLLLLPAAELALAAVVGAVLARAARLRAA